MKQINTNHPCLVRVARQALAEPMGGALIFQLVAHPPEPRNITALPGAGACAAARACGTSAGARLVVAPEFFALVEVDQRGVAWFGEATDERTWEPQMFDDY